MKKLHFLLYLFLSITTILTAQEVSRKGAHQQQLIELGSTQKVPSKFAANGSGIIKLEAKETNTLSKIIFGFLPYWEYANGAHNNLNYSLLTHIAAFNFQTSSTGAITNPPGWPWTDVINAAHSNGVKIIMVVNNFTASEINTLLTNNVSKTNLFNAIKNTIATYQLDGVNIDFEGLNTSDRGALLNTFMADLTDFIHTNIPGKEVSFDSPAVNWSGWDLNGLAQSVDYLFIMAYDYNGSWSTITGAVAPLTHPSGGISVTNSLNNDYSVPIANAPEKLILGVPYYGKHWKTSSSSAGASITSYVGSTFYRNTAIEAATHGGNIWDTNSQTPFYSWLAGGWNQVWADNEQSIALKYDLAINKNLGGIGIWALNYDGNRSELWNLIDAKFNNTLAVDDFVLQQQISIYPNPTENFLNIATTQNLEIATIEIFNIYGQQLKSYPPNSRRINIGHYKNGVYFLKIKDVNRRRVTFKIIKSP